MAEIIDDIVHLTQEIGPHPAGTEEEQQAALYVAEELQKGAGFSTVIEDFQCVTNSQLPRLICFGAAFLAALISLILPIAGIPCLVVAVIAAVILALEALGRPVLSRLFRTGASQNVVAKYEPAPQAGVKRRRKVILVANYDGGRVLQEEKPPIAKLLPLLQKICFGALIAVPVIVLFRSVVFADDTGAASSVLSFLLVVSLILVVLPLVRSILHIVAPYSQAANNNAAGVGVLLDVARQVGNGLVSNEELEERAAREGGDVHGEEAARAAGVVPEGATLEYDTGMSSQESLAAAKAAIAALTGKPVADKVPVADISSRLVKGGGLDPADEEAASTVRFEVGETPYVRTPSQAGEYRRSPEPESAPLPEEEAATPAAEAPSEPAAPAAAVASPAPVAPAPSVPIERETPVALQGAGYTGATSSVDKVPAWARIAQEKARANKPEASQPQRAQRSRYADAPAAHMSEPQAAPACPTAAPATDADAQPEEPQTELGARLAALRSEIESAEAPQISAKAQAVLDTMSEDDVPEAAPAAKSAAPRATAPARTAAPARDAAVPQRQTTSATLRAPMSGAAARQQESFPEESVDHTQPIPADEARSAAPARAAEPVSEYAGERVVGDIVVEDEELAHRARPSAESHTHHRSVGTLLRSGSRAVANVMHKPQKKAPVTETTVEEVDDFEVVEREAPAAEAPYDERRADEPIEDYENPADFDEDVEPELPAAPITSSPSPSATAAISPIDVSAYLDKEETPAPAARLRRTPRENRAAAPEPDDLASEETQRVSSEQIQVAIKEASAADPVVPPRESVPFEDEAAAQAPASPIIGMGSLLPTVPQPGEAGSTPEKKHQVIVLPDVVSTHTSSDDQKQRAPMAVVNESTQAGNKSLLSSMLPRIGDSGTLAPVTPSDVKRPDTFGADLPPLGASDSGPSAVSATSSFSTVGGTGSFAPVGDELVADIDPEERYVDDADDSAYDEEFTETGAFAGPGYVDMPKSRAGRLFGRFRSKKKKQEHAEDTSVREWVDVDEDYNARSVGKARGDWSSFREENDPVLSDDQDGFVDVDYHDSSFKNDRGWNGGAFSLSRLRKGAKADPVDDVPYDEAYDQAHLDVADAPVRERSVAMDEPEPEAVEQLNRELRKLQDFRHPDINTEVWFVALGSELYSHSGMQAFLEEHADEMKGAIVINLEALGAGTLSCIESEGAIKSYKPSSRVKRFLRQASERSGVGYRTAALKSRETPATIAMAQGIQALTIAGMGESNTALYGADNDVIENIDEDMLKDAASFVMAVLKSV